jgi:DnaJ-domain-containing protein 1
LQLRAPDRHRVTDNPGISVDAVEALQRELAALRDLLQSQIGSLDGRLAEFARDHEEKHRSVVEAAISHRKELSDLGTASLKSEVFSRLEEMDRRYQQRFEAQGTATVTALSSAEKAVQTALVSAEKAVAKAEVETDTRITELERQIDRRMDSEQQALAQARALSEKRYETIMGELPQIAEALERIAALDRVTDAKFITFRTLVDSEAEKVALALNASDKAVTKAEVANEKRFESVNEFRSQLNDQSKTFVSRVEFISATGSLVDKVDDLKQSVAGLGSSVDSRLATIAGRASGLNAGWVYLLGALAAFGTLISFIVMIKK